MDVYAQYITLERSAFGTNKWFSGHPLGAGSSAIARSTSFFTCYVTASTT